MRRDKFGSNDINLLLTCQYPRALTAAITPVFWLFISLC
jgi:hypothetical protein